MIGKYLIGAGILCLMLGGVIISIQNKEYLFGIASVCLAIANGILFRDVLF